MHNRSYNELLACLVDNDDDWTLNGVGLMSGETIKARERPDKTIVLSVYSAFNNKVYHIYDQFRPIQKHFILSWSR